MEVKITGAGGYLGKLINKELNNHSHKISAISRKSLYDPPELLSDKIAGTTVLINLAGAPILQRWTKKNRDIIYNSRVITAQNIVKAVNLLPDKLRPQKIISVSAIGIYKVDSLHDENSSDFDTGFLGNLVKDWENTWKLLPENVNMSIFRTAIVLGSEAVIIKKLIPLFKLGMGGKLGTGKQPFPFIHEKDVCEAFLLTLEEKLAPGIYNLAAPDQITNDYFTKALAKTVRKPAILRVPAFALKILYGEAAGILTESPAVIPKKLLEYGFNFNYPTIEKVMKDII